MKKILGGIAALTLVFGLFSVGTAQAATTWNVSGTYDVAFSCTPSCAGEPYHHKMTLVQDSSGNLTGTGGYPYSGPYAYSWHITSGTISGNALNLTAVYDTGATGTVMHISGTIDGTGHFTSGMWDDNFGGARIGTWTTSFIATPLTTSVTGGTLSGGGKITGNNSPSGKPKFTFDIESSGHVNIVNHQVSPPCVYAFNTSGMTFTTNTASIMNVSGNKTNCAHLSFTFTNSTSGADKLKVGSDEYPIVGGSIDIQTTSDDNLVSFAATSSSYYNGSTSSAPLYGSGPVSFTWDTSTGTVTGGYYTEQVPANTGTVYYNLITGGTVSGNNVTLNFYRDNPNNNSFSFTGTLTGGMLTGQLDGPYLFTATGNTM